MTNPSERLWFVIREGTRTGPLLGRSISQVNLDPDTLVWSEGMPNWAPVRDTTLCELVFGKPPEIPLPRHSSAPPTVPDPPPFPDPSTRNQVKDSATINEYEQLEMRSLRNDPACIPPPLPIHTNIGFEPISTPGEKAPSYFVRHWRGDLSLSRSYWVNIILLGVALSLLGVVFFNILDLSVRASAIAYLAMLFCLFVIWIWQIVGLYRSVKTHELRGGTRAGTVWGWIGVFILLGGTVWTSINSTIPAGVEMFKIVLGDKEFGHLNIRLLPSGREIEIKGVLQAGCSGDFRDFAEKIPQAAVLHINCIGGRIKEAYAIADVVANRKMITYVSGKCLSAATVIFVAGKERYANTSAQFGFHSVSFPGLSDYELAETNAEVGRRMRLAGVSYEFVQRAIHTPGTDMWMPNLDELVAAGFVHNVTGGERFGMSSAVLASLEQLEDDLLAMPVYRNLKAYDPSAFDRLIRIAEKMSNDGASFSEVIVKMRTELMVSLTEALQFASDESLARFFDLQIRVCELFSAKYPIEVYNLLLGLPQKEGSTNLTKLPGYPIDSELEVVAEIFESASLRIRKPFDQEHVNSSVLLVFERMQESYPDSLMYFLDSDNLQDHPNESAAALLLYFKTMRLYLTPSQIAEIIRTPEAGDK